MWAKSFVCMSSNFHFFFFLFQTLQAVDQLLTSLSPGKLYCCPNLKLTLMWFSVTEMCISAPTVELSGFFF